MSRNYVQRSYVTFGNDSLHFNDSINAMPNTAVDSVTAQALHDASDHLPVYIDFEFVGITAGVEQEDVWQRREMDLSDGREGR